MATRSTISIIKNDGEVDSIYCHFDGYLDNNGEILLNHYTDSTKIKKLISGGYLRSLGEFIEPFEFREGYDGKLIRKNEHKILNKQKDVCCYFYRDGDDAEIFIDKYQSLKEFLKLGNFQDYNYFFKESENKWYVTSYGYDFIELSDAIQLEKNNED